MRGRYAGMLTLACLANLCRIFGACTCKPQRSHPRIQDNAAHTLFESSLGRIRRWSAVMSTVDTGGMGLLQDGSRQQSSLLLSTTQWSLCHRQAGQAAPQNHGLLWESGFITPRVLQQGKCCLPVITHCSHGGPKSCDFEQLLTSNEIVAYHDSKPTMNHMATMLNCETMPIAAWSLVVQTKKETAGACAPDRRA